MSDTPTRREFLLTLSLAALASQRVTGQPTLVQPFRFQRVETNGVTLRCAIEGSGPLVIMVHGFPELWYSWRHQIRPVADAGFRVVAPDVRGYGESDKPHPVAAYDMASLTGDVGPHGRAWRGPSDSSWS